MKWPYLAIADQLGCHLCRRRRHPGLPLDAHPARPEAPAWSLALGGYESKSSSNKNKKKRQTKTPADGLHLFYHYIYTKLSIYISISWYTWQEIHIYIYILRYIYIYIHGVSCVIMSCVPSRVLFLLSFLGFSLTIILFHFCFWELFTMTTTTILFYIYARTILHYSFEIDEK